MARFLSVRSRALGVLSSELVLYQFRNIPFAFPSWYSWLRSEHIRRPLLFKEAVFFVIGRRAIYCKLFTLAQSRKSCGFYFLFVVSNSCSKLTRIACYLVGVILPHSLAGAHRSRRLAACSLEGESCALIFSIQLSPENSVDFIFIRLVRSLLSSDENWMILSRWYPPRNLNELSSP